MKHALTLAALLALSIALPAGADEIKIGAGAAPTENILKPIKAAFEKATGHKLTILASGPKVALQDLQAGSVDAAAAGLSVEDWLQLMKKEGAEVRNPGALQTFTVGKDRIVVIVHKGNPVTKLSKEQLKALFTGAAANWKDVGGPDAMTMVVWGKLIPGTNSVFAGAMLDGGSVTKDVLEVGTAEEVRQNVASNPEAVGIGPAAIVDATVRSPDTPEIGRPITVATVGKPSAKVQALLDFIKGDGQRLVRR